MSDFYRKYRAAFDEFAIDQSAAYIPREVNIAEPPNYVFDLNRQPVRNLYDY